jgi:nitrogen regulatory protein PII
MVAARKAGATGGTVINARGTGKEEDVKFFGITLVPEKEVLLILVDADKADAVLDAVKDVPCLSEPGSGIAYCTGVEDFFRLGKKAG